MFLVKDTSAAREARLLELSASDPSLALIATTVHVEWTLRRAIIALGTSPNAAVRARLARCHGPDAYKNVWHAEVTPRLHQRLPDVISDWHGLVRAWRLRHVLVHGARTCGAAHAQQRVRWALAAARDVRRCCAAHAIDLDRRLPVRRGIGRMRDER